MIDHYRQGGRGLSPARAPELIAKGGKEEWSGFPSDTGERQQNGGENATISSGDGYPRDGFPFTGAEGPGGFAQGDRHGTPKPFGAAQRDRDYHKAQGKSSGRSWG